MRTVYPINNKWAFSKEATAVPAAMPANWHLVNLPHCWNNIDGQDGGNDYYRGTCYYARELNRSDLPPADRYYLEIRGANSSAAVFLNGRELASHDGGYSTWRVELTDSLEADNLLVIRVDNSPNDRVYPQVADFTFYGGLYRDVNLICVSDSHFDLDDYGAPGLKITPEICGRNARVTVEVSPVNARDGQELRCTLLDAAGNPVAQTKVPVWQTKLELTIENVHLWHGRRNPYLYRAEVQLLDGETVLDNISSRFGCRSFAIDPENGFFLNGEAYPLRGVSRHQDRWGLGNALLPEHHREDMALICELGATTIRLAHYQHDQYFYDLCDEFGMVVWAEIPYISQHMASARENTLQQMTELIAQNYNHPSIVVWGLSNEITMKGDTDPDLIENHRLLNALCHEMDKTRPTTMAVVSPCPIDSPYVHIPDTVSYNHYFGWYGGDAAMNGPWFDRFHARYPDLPIGCSEYGCEGLNWHTSQPTQGDYTEEYQAYYHEELIKQFFSRKYLWATHVWNMFDFGADARAEGGENGQNHKGLVTFDRKYKKDAFYAYKAWLSDDPFVHLCGKRYRYRVEDVTRVTVYSNQPAVELFANGVSLGRQESPEHFFYFDVPNAGQTTLTAVAGDCTDESRICKVAEFYDAYRLKEKNAVLNWFDIEEPEGRFSLHDKIGDILQVPEGAALFQRLLETLMPKNEPGGTEAAGFELSGAMLEMLYGFTVLRMTSMLGMMNIRLTREQLLDLNAQLNQIRKN